MNYMEMYEGLVNSPITIIINEIGENDTIIEVGNGNLLPEPPNLLVIGGGSDSPETVRMIEKAGNIITVERGFQGQMQEWSVGTEISRYYTEYDQKAFIHNIRKLIEDKVDNSRVLTDVPEGAVFTDTITSINGRVGIIRKSDIVELGIPAQDTVYEHPTDPGYKHIPAGGEPGQILKHLSDGTAKWEDEVITTINGKTGVIEKADIVALGIPGQDTVYEHPPVYHIPPGGEEGQILEWDEAGSAKWGHPIITSINGKTGVIEKDDIVALGIPAQDTVYTHPVGDGAQHMPAGGEPGQILVNIEPGHAEWRDEIITSINGKTGIIEKEDIVALGIPAQDTVYEHPIGDGANHIPNGGEPGQILINTGPGEVEWGEQTSINGKTGVIEKEDIVAIGIPAQDTIYVHPNDPGNKHIPLGGTQGQYLKFVEPGVGEWADPVITTINGKTGVITKEDIVSLGIPAQDTVYVHPDTPGNKHIPEGGETGQILRQISDGTARWSDETITTINGKTGVITKEDIVSLGIPAQDTVYRHPSLEDDEFSKPVRAFSNNDNSRQIRNIIFSTENPEDTDGEDGDVWVVYPDLGVE